MIRPRQRPWHVERLHERMPQRTIPLQEGLFPDISSLIAYNESMLRKAKEEAMSHRMSTLPFHRLVFNWIWP